MTKLLSGKLTSKGQLTIPAAIRSQLNLEEGDRLEFELGPDGTIAGIHPRKKTSIRQVYGIFKTDKTDSKDFPLIREEARERRIEEYVRKNDRAESDES
jgi:AbrB family looped-hinge helix DNA binding protein